MQLNISQAQIGPDTIAESSEFLDEYIRHIQEVVAKNDYTSNEASVLLPSDDEMFESCCKVADVLGNEKLKSIVHIGIGGSNLGPKCIYTALKGYAAGYGRQERYTPLFLDTNDATQMHAVAEYIEREINDLDEIAVISVSKSGGTTESLVHTEFVLQQLRNKFGEQIYSRVAIISGEHAPFYQTAREKGMHTLPIQELVGGRYSVFSPVGLLTLLLLEIDVQALLSGAVRMRKLCISSKFSENIAVQSAIVLHLHNRAGKHIHSNFIFHPELELVGKWYRQLMSESIGKRNNTKGDVVFAGMTPEISIGSTDLHSMAQLYLGGPRDKVTTFINASVKNPVHIGEDRVFPEIVPMVSGKNTTEIMSAIYDGTKIAYQKNDLPYMEILLDEVNEFEIGALLQMKMFEILYLGRLMEINPFDQPSVEDYKIETKKILET